MASTPSQLLCLSYSGSLRSTQYFSTLFPKPHLCIQSLRDRLCPHPPVLIVSDSNCSAGCLEPSPSFLDFGVSPSFGFPNNNASQTPVQLTSDVTKTEFYFGLPLAGYANADDRYAAQIAVIEDFVKLTKRHIDAADGNAGLRVGFIARVLLLDYFFGLIFKDVAYVALAIAIVGIYMSIYMQSGFLASCSMLHILLSFPIAYLFTQAFMDFGPMGVLNLMALFIILGIGADGRPEGWRWKNTHNQA